MGAIFTMKGKISSELLRWGQSGGRPGFRALSAKCAECPGSWKEPGGLQVPLSLAALVNPATGLLPDSRPLTSFS